MKELSSNPIPANEHTLTYSMLKAMVKAANVKYTSKSPARTRPFKPQQQSKLPRHPYMPKNDTQTMYNSI